MKISIIIPIENDSISSVELLKSIMWQQYKNWEAIIVNYGDIENNDLIISYIKNYDEERKITYIHKNSGNKYDALLIATKYAKGDIFYIMENGSELINENVFDNVINYFENNMGVDAIIFDIPKWNENKENIGTNYINDYSNDKSLLPLTILNNGMNLFTNNAIFTSDAFFKNVIENYIVWNRPFWINSDNTILNVKKVNFLVNKELIDNSDVHYMNKIRLVLNLLKNYNITFFKLQYILFKNRNLKYKIIYKNKQTKNKYKILSHIVKKLNLKNNYLNSLLNFYKIKTKKTIFISDFDDKLYYGKDVEEFLNELEYFTNNNIYFKIMEEMKSGFDKVIVDSETTKEKIQYVLDFLCIDVSVEMGEVNDKKNI